MNRKKNYTQIIYTVMLLTIFSLTACTSNLPILPKEQAPAEEKEKIVENSELEPMEDTIVSQDETISPAIETESSSNNTSGLTDSEFDSLIFMREEEKLAHDVYLALYDLWGLPLFQNIAGSEQTHTDAVKNLLDNYDIPDPADTSPAGIFVNADLQALYNELTQYGAESLTNALKVGAAIEEIDILDLQEALEFTQNASIRRVYENLLRGSENHLRAFTATLERQLGEVYEPQYMSEAAYNSIVRGGNEQGSRGRGRRP